jgi:hypothetical protein
MRSPETSAAATIDALLVLARIQTNLFMQALSRRSVKGYKARANGMFETRLGRS